MLPTTNETQPSRIASSIQADSPRETQLPESAEFDECFRKVRDDVYRFIHRRFNSKLRRRLDASDVMQDTQMVAFKQYAAYRENPPMPFRIWLLKTAQEQLIQAYRTHVTTAKRTLKKEIAWSDCSSMQLANDFIASGSSPSHNIRLKEDSDIVQRAIDDLPESDREILVMRYLENRPYDDIAILMSIQQEAARQRCGRALIKLKTKLSHLGLLEQRT